MTAGGVVRTARADPTPGGADRKSSSGSGEVMARSGQLSAASRTFASASTGTSGAATEEWPSSSSEKTSGQICQQRAWP